MRDLRTPLAWSSAAALVVLAGCFYSPLGTNQSTELYPTPGADGTVTLTYVPPASADVTQVTFLLEPPAGEEVTENTPSVTDDSPDDDFTATFDTANLEFGVHFVSIFLGDEEEPSGRLAFVKPDPELLTEEEPAEGEATEGEATEGEATEGEATDGAEG